jgi:hypothetical protein
MEAFMRFGIPGKYGLPDSFLGDDHIAPPRQESKGSFRPYR